MFSHHVNVFQMEELTVAMANGVLGQDVQASAVHLVDLLLDEPEGVTLQFP